MMLDSNGLPVTKNEYGYDGGDSLANYCRWKLGWLLNNPSGVLASVALQSCEVAPGIFVRHPGTGRDPEGKAYSNVPYFWNDPKQLSRDNSRALHWLLLITKQPLETYQHLMSRYRGRGYLLAQNGDVMLPLYLAKYQPFLLLRDLELLYNTFTVCGLIPVNKHDNPKGFGKGKRWFFSWQDEDWCDGDTNLLVDMAGSKLYKPTLLSSFATWLYKKIRKAKYIRHYYRTESGNNPEIAELYVKGFNLDARI